MIKQCCIFLICLFLACDTITDNVTLVTDFEDGNNGINNYAVDTLLLFPTIKDTSCTLTGTFEYTYEENNVTTGKLKSSADSWDVTRIMTVKNDTILKNGGVTVGEPDFTVADIEIMAEQNGWGLVLQYIQDTVALDNFVRKVMTRELSEKTHRRMRHYIGFNEILMDEKIEYVNGLDTAILRNLNFYNENYDEIWGSLKDSSVERIILDSMTKDYQKKGIFVDSTGKLKTGLNFVEKAQLKWFNMHLTRQILFWNFYQVFTRFPAVGPLYRLETKEYFKQKGKNKSSTVNRYLMHNGYSAMNQIAFTTPKDKIFSYPAISKVNDYIITCDKDNMVVAPMYHIPNIPFLTEQQFLQLTTGTGFTTEQKVGSTTEGPLLIHFQKKNYYPVHGIVTIDGVEMLVIGSISMEIDFTHRKRDILYQNQLQVSYDKWKCEYLFTAESIDKTIKKKYFGTYLLKGKKSEGL